MKIGLFLSPGTSMVVKLAHEMTFFGAGVRAKLGLRYPPSFEPQAYLNSRSALHSEALGPGRLFRVRIRPVHTVNVVEPP
jgi:hypothetical protein